MKKYRILALAFAAVGLILSHAMCANVAFEYCNMLWGIEYLGYSAPADIAFFLVIPYLFAIIIAFVLAFIFWKKTK